MGKHATHGWYMVLAAWASIYGRNSVFPHGAISRVLPNKQNRIILEHAASARSTLHQSNFLLLSTRTSSGVARVWVVRGTWSTHFQNTTVAEGHFLADSNLPSSNFHPPESTRGPPQSTTLIYHRTESTTTDVHFKLSSVEMPPLS